MKKKTEMVNGVEIELASEVLEEEVVVEGGDVIDEGAQVAAEEAQAEDEDEMAGAEGSETEEADLDWKAARDVLKGLWANVGWSIDDYEHRIKVTNLRARFNAKERTFSLHSEIMELAPVVEE